MIAASECVPTSSWESALLCGFVDPQLLIDRAPSTQGVFNIRVFAI